MTIAGAMRRLYWAVRWKFQPIPIVRPAVSFPVLPPVDALPAEPLVRYVAPAGGGWVPVSDWEYNVKLEERGAGWRQMCAIELWRPDWAKSVKVFSSWLFNLNREDAVGMLWRPLPHGYFIPLTVQ